MARPPEARFSKRPSVVTGLALVALIAIAWFLLRGGSAREPALGPVAVSPAPAMAAAEPTLEPGALSAVERRVVEEAPREPAPAPPPAELVLKGTFRILADTGAALEGARIVVTVVPHAADQPCAGRELELTDPDGRTRVTFPVLQARLGFPLSAEQEEFHRGASARGERMVAPGPPPGDADTCAIAVTVDAKGHRAFEALHSFSIEEATRSGFECELRLPSPPRAPLLHLTVVDAVTRAPVAGAVVQYDPGHGEERCYAVTDANGRAHQVLGVRMKANRLAKDSPDPETLPRSEGIPLAWDNLGSGRRVSVEHFPDHAPGSYWFHVTEAWVEQTDIHETLALQPRRWISLALVDSSTGQAIVGGTHRATLTFLSRYPLEALKKHPWLEQEMAQQYPMVESPLRVGLDAPDCDGVLVIVESQRVGGNHRHAYVPHFVPADELESGAAVLTRELDPFPRFQLFFRDLDAPDRPVISAVRAVLEGSKVASQIVWGNATVERSDVRLEESAHKTAFPGHPEFQLGAIRISEGGSLLHPDLQSLEFERLSLSGTGFDGYEILGPNLEVLSPWSDGEERGKLLAPLVFLAGGKRVIGDAEGNVTLYVRRKRAE